ncbi:hypothetical protein HN446_03680 [bacterium]|nr:hypothetical protein [bacterium]
MHALYFFIFLLFVSSFLNPEGFVKGTLVLTSNGYTKIESLVPGDRVLCSDLKETITVGVVKEILRYAVDLIIGKDVK